MIELFEPNNVNWYLLPLVIAISLVYSATRFENWTLIWKHAIRWAIYILTFLGGTFAFFWLIPLDWHPFWYLLILVAVFCATYWGGGSKKASSAEKNADPKKG